MYYIIMFTDGSMTFLGNEPKKEHHQKGTKFFKVDGDLTVADISEVWSGNGWIRGIFPERLQKKITSI